MAKKRGGLAGIYDRNKGLIQKAVPAALSFIPGVGVPLAAASGALMRGLDRPGQSGVGFNAFEGLKGGIEGYGIGKGTQAVAGGVKGMLTAGAPKAATGGAAPFDFSGSGVGTNPLDVTKSPVRDLAGMTDSAGNALKQSRVQGLLKGARENKDLIAMAGKGLMAAMPDPANDAAMMNAETARQRLEFEKDEQKRQRELEDERRRRIAELLMPYAQQTFPQYFGNR